MKDDLIILNNKISNQYETDSVDKRVAFVLQKINNKSVQEIFSELPNEHLIKIKQIVLCLKATNIFMASNYLRHTNTECSFVDNFFDINDYLSLTNLEIENNFIKNNKLFISEDFLFGYKVKFDNIDYFLLKNNNIKKNDFIIHDKYGVGIFHDTVKMKNHDDIVQEFIKLEYSNKTILYLSVFNWKNIFLYECSDKTTVVLDSIKSNSWKKKKDKARSRIKQLANKIIKNQAIRAQIVENESIMYDFNLFKNELDRFKDSFEFNYTSGQKRSIEEIFKDLKSGLPMDRLLVADVGFGKTEVIMNAALIVTLSRNIKKNFQVVIVCPTLILASQHYKTFKSRFSLFSNIKVDFISGFISKEKQGDIKKKFAEGEINILICTHAIFYGKINISNVGLIVFDEEHMFGVEQKEKIKFIKRDIHILSSSATPIPRTLHSALMSIKDMSIIDTPPENRRDVVTEVIDESDIDRKKEIINNEIKNDYQILIISAKISDLNQIEKFVSNDLGEKNYIVLHGQMEKYYIEEKMHDFLNSKYKILISTTIVTLGCDFENVNTIVINRPENFGSTQIHQIRGRVGRRDRQSYCYILKDNNKVLSENTEKRIETIMNFNKVGSGLSISSADLDIRGAGNLLGKEQKGHIIDIGISLYTRMLKEEIAIISSKESNKGDLYNFKDSIEIKSNVDRFIPDDYIKNHEDKFKVYRQMSLLGDSFSISNFENELQVNYGKMPKEVVNLITDIKIKILLKNIPVEYISINTSRVKIFFINTKELNIEKIILITQKNNNINISQKDNSLIIEKENLIDYIENVNLIENFTNQYIDL